MVKKMIITADEIMRVIARGEKGRQANAVRTTGKRRVRPEGPCKEAHRGCKGRTGRGHKRTAHGWCANCYGRWYKYGDPFGHGSDTSKCTSKDCPLHPITERKRKLPPHAAPGETQYVIRFTPKNGDKSPYYSAVFKDRDRADQELGWFLANDYPDARLLQRIVPSWEPVA